MKKVAIVTFHRALNYGAKLQAFALQQTISERYDTYILDYRCPAIENFYYKNFTIKDFIKKIIFPSFMKQLKVRKARFISFDKEFNLTKPYTPDNVIEANNDIDAFVAGSDQIWNPMITGNDYNYFLKFSDISKRFSYAISMGKATIKDWDKDKFPSLLNSFQNLSFRERTTVDIVKNNYPNLKPYITMDPVFLLSKDQWIQKFNLKYLSVSKKYIFLYIVAPQTNAIEKAKAIAKDKNMDILYVDALRLKDDMITNVNNVGPYEFMELLLNAELVITTSFHALAFSLILNRPFLYELSREKVNANSRLVDIAEKFEIKNFEITNRTKEYNDEYKWNNINSQLGELRESSKDSLFESLKNI